MPPRPTTAASLVAEPLVPAPGHRTTGESGGQSHGGTAGELNTDFLLETVIYDFLWTALHVGILTTLLNACTKTKVDWSIRPWHHILRDSNKVMQLALRYGAEMGMTDLVRARLSKFYQGVGAGMSEVAPLMRNAAMQSNAERARAANVCALWRRIAQDAKDTLTAIEDAAILRLGGFVQEDSRTLFAFLGEAAAGDVRRVDAAGAIALPNLKQMRRTPRLRLDSACMIDLGDRAVPARLQDISVDGLGIACDQPLPAEGIITVVMDDGRRLPCRLARRDGNRIGLKFETRLRTGDPLFRRK